MTAHDAVGRVLFVALFVAAAVLSLFAGNSATAHAADGEPVRLVSVEHTINFGRGVDVRMQADLPPDESPVVEVRAVFTSVGERNVSSYAYPAFQLSPAGSGSSLTANFTIDTGVRAYYPPGTEFELFFELTGNDGSVTSTEPERFLYLDPAKDWKLLAVTGAPLDIYYYGVSEASAGRIADRVSETWHGVAGALGVDSESVERFRAVIYPNVTEFTSVFPPTSAASTDGLFYGGFAMERYGVFVQAGTSPDTAIHEFTHLLVGTKVSSPLSPGAPSWLNEGLAQYFEAGSSGHYTDQLRSAAASNRLLTLRTRNTGPSLASEIGLYYLEVGSFVGELIEMHGAGPVAETLRLINDGSAAADAVEAAFGTPLWQLENAWRVRLGASELPPPVVPVGTEQPGPTATTSPTSQATATSQAGSVPGAGVVAGDGGGSGDDGFNWTGPLIGAAAAGIVFAIWSFRVNRRRFRSRRR